VSSDSSVSKDAMRWAPGEADGPAEDPDLQGLLDLQDLGRALGEALRPLVDFADAVIRDMSAWAERNREPLAALAKMAADPRVQAAVEAERRRRALGLPRACHCLCGRSHPGTVNVCEADRPVIARRYVTEALGAVDVPLCAPCASAQGVPIPARGMAVSAEYRDEP
jgi:hypothetical protein